VGRDGKNNSKSSGEGAIFLVLHNMPSDNEYDVGTQWTFRNNCLFSLALYKALSKSG